MTDQNPTMQETNKSGFMSALTRIRAAFLSHPESVDETYLQHAGVALWFARHLFVATLAALVHAILPFAFEKTASNRIRYLFETMQVKGR